MGPQTVRRRFLWLYRFRPVIEQEKYRQCDSAGVDSSRDARNSDQSPPAMSKLIAEAGRFEIQFPRW